jgi:hypothetical protein
MDKYLQVEASIDQRVANLGTRTLVGRVANVNDGTNGLPKKDAIMVPQPSDHALADRKRIAGLFGTHQAHERSGSRTNTNGMTIPR